MKESIAKEETKQPFLPNNKAHLYGHINDVRMNETQSGRTAINLDVVTREEYKDKAGEFQTKRSYHDVVLFTDKQETIDKFAAIAADCQANRANKGVEGYKPATHSVSLDGILVNRTNAIGESEDYTRSVAILSKEDNVKTDVKQEEKETRNRIDFTGNVASIDLHQDKGFAKLTLANHYRPEGKGTEGDTTWLEVRVDSGRKFSKDTYEAIAKGEIAKGDFIHVGGQLHNDRYEAKNGTAYKNVVDLTSFKMIDKKQAKAEAQEVKAEAKPAKPAKAETKAAKDAPKKKATSKKGVRMG